MRHNSFFNIILRTNYHSVAGLDDTRIHAYTALKDRDVARQGGRFIAEGEHLLRRLLASDYGIESVFLSERRAELANLIPEAVPVYVAPSEVLNQIIGYKFHSGVLACGLRGPRRTLEEIIPRAQSRLRIVICEDINNAENLGGIVRVAAGFGADALVLGERCVDPFWRQCVRVSMGTIFSLPLVQSENLLADLKKLREGWKVELVATVLANDAEMLGTATPSPRMALLFGGEAQGLTAAAIAACDRRITIPMHLGTDSLNVAVTAGIFLYHFCQEAGGTMNAAR
jgi:tRNA G18 (ribose-2'-O)-methylase SpoU